MRSAANKMRVPITKRGTASRRYHSMRAIVLIARFPNCGNRIGGISRIKSEDSPGMTLDARYPTRRITPTMIPTHATVAAGPISESIPRMTPSWAEQGMPRARRSVTITRSFRVSRIRVVSVAMVSHPSPRIMGSTAFPLQPIFLKIRSTMTARRGRDPGASRDPEPQKEGPYDRQHDGDRVGERHGDDPVGAHEDVPDHPPGDRPLHRPGGRRHDPFSEHALLEP